jgi:iron complex outermembrane recepter protein
VPGVPGTGKAVAGTNPLIVCNANLPLQNGSNPEVLPEKARNLTLGMVLEPVKNMMVSFDYFDIAVKDAIGSLAQNAIFADTKRYADLFVRNPDGSLAYVKNITSNLGRLRTNGIDVTFSYALPRTSMGDFKIGLDGTRVLRFDSQNEKDGPWISNLGRFGSNGSGTSTSSPTYTFAWKHTLRLSWAKGDWFTQLTQAYNTKYQDLNAVLPQYYREIKPYTVWNSTVSYKGVKNTQITLGVSNLLDEDPPLTNSNATGYANNIASPIGRAFNVRVSHDF